MKKIITLLFAVFALFQYKANAQANIVVNEVTGFMSQGQQPGFEVFIPEADKKSVESNWGKFMKSYKAKVSSSKKSIEVFADNATIPAVSENTVDVYAIAQNAQNGIKLVVFTDLGGGFVSSSQYTLAATAMQAVLREFALTEMKRTVDTQSGSEEKILKGLEKELSSLQKSKDGYLKEIEKAKALIAQRQQDIAQNEATQATKMGQIELQKQIISTIKQKRMSLGK